MAGARPAACLSLAATSAAVANCWIANCTAERHGGGITINDTGGVGCGGGSGAGLSLAAVDMDWCVERRWCSAAPLVVAGARIADCAAPGGGSGVFLQVAAAGLVAAGLILERNAAAAGFGGGIASGGGAALGPGACGIFIHSSPWRLKYDI